MRLYSISDEYISYLRKNAKVLYSKRKSGDENKVVQNCLDFVALERECDNWKNKEDRIHQ